MELLKLYINLSQASVLLPIAAGIRNYKVLTKPFKVLFYLFIVAVLAEISSLIAIALWRNNLPGLYIYTACEFTAFSIAFAIQMPHVNWKRIIGLNIIIFIVLGCVEFLSHGLTKPNDLSRGYASAFLTIYALRYFYFLFYKESISYVWEYPMFWICTGVLIYFGVNTIYFMSRSYLIDEASRLEWVYNYFHGGLNIFAYLLYAQSFRCLGKQKMAH